MARLLIVEDDHMLRKIFVDQLESAFTLDAVATRKEALNLITICDYDGILLDLRLPDSLVTETVGAIKHAAPRSAIIVITGYSDPVLTRQCILDNAADVLIKTVDNANSESFINRIKTAMVNNSGWHKLEQARKMIEENHL